MSKDSLRYVIDIKNVSKIFRRSSRATGSYTTLKSWLVSAFFGRQDSQHENVSDELSTVALDEVTLRVPAGSSVGIIGRNGSGKSTLLKLISGIYRADSGELQVAGRIAALIELGAGFHPDFTGKENLFLAGVMHGLTKKELEALYDTIVKFAELEGVMDDPVRTYSSGMFMRLGFSIAVHTNPDILIIDEVLAVGDATFVVKCKEKLAELKREGKTLLLVTHDLDSVERWCDEVIWLDKGVVKDRGQPRRVLDHYRQFVQRGEEIEILQGEQKNAAPQQGFHEHGQDETKESQSSELAVTQEPERWGSREISIEALELLDASSEVRRVFNPEDPCILKIHYRINEHVQEPVLGFCINRTDGLVVLGTNTDIETIPVSLEKDSGVVQIDIARLGLLDGSYTVDIAVHAPDGYPYDYIKAAAKFSVRSEKARLGVTLPPCAWSFEQVKA